MNDTTRRLPPPAEIRHLASTTSVYLAVVRDVSAMVDEARQTQPDLFDSWGWLQDVLHDALEPKNGGSPAQILAAVTELMGGDMTDQSTTIGVPPELLEFSEALHTFIAAMRSTHPAIQAWAESFPEPDEEHYPDDARRYLAACLQSALMLDANGSMEEPGAMLDALRKVVRLTRA